MWIRVYGEVSDSEQLCVVFCLLWLPGLWTMSEFHFNCAPRYLAESIRPLSDDTNRSRLRSSKSADVTIPRTKTKMGDRAFRVAGPRAWNNLPGSIQATKTLPAFKKQLKLHLLHNSEH